MSEIEFETRGAVAWIKLNRPEVINAFNAELLNGLNAAIDRYRDDDTLKVAVIHGAGERGFSAGVDLKAYAASLSEGRTSQEQMNIIRFADPEYCGKPVVAAIHGWCVGMGLHLALACDIRVCASDARFALPEVSIGISVTRLSWQCVHVMGLPAALELGLLAEKKDAQWALSNRLVHRVVPVGEELAEAGRLAQRLSQMDAQAVRVSRQTMYKSLEMNYAQMLKYSLPLRNAVLEGGQDREAVEAFAHRRG